MLGITHALISLALAKSLGMAGFGDYSKIFVLVFYSLLPDIDMPYSELGKLFLPASRYLYAKFGHRNVTHSLIFMLLVTSPLALNQQIYFLALLAYGSHLTGDSLTYMGIPWLWPYEKNFNFLGGPIITGRWTEALISIVSLGIFIAA